MSDKYKIRDVGKAYFVTLTVVGWIDIFTPDNYIQAPEFTQSFNRYAYCLNNPLMYTDPSGYTWWNKFWNWVGEGFDNFGKWCDKHHITFRFGTNMSSGNNVPFVNAESNGRSVTVGYNVNTGNVGFGNGSANDLYYPSVNYGASEQVALQNIEWARQTGWQQAYAANSEKNKPLPTLDPFSGVNLNNNQGQGVTPFDVGVEWLTGTGPRHRDFTNGDVFTEMLRQHDHVLSTKASLPGLIANGTMKGNAPYRLSGFQGVGKYIKDYSTLVTGGLTGNLAVTYLGSYNLQWEVTSLDKASATVLFTVNNSSTIQSATRPPVLGYTSW